MRPLRAVLYSPKGGICAALAAAALLAACAGDRAASGRATVARVSDGDTLTLVSGERVRLVQIDAPELGEGECYARAAARALAELVPPGSQVRLEPDPRLDDVDRFGRLLRYVFAGETNVNLELVRLGAASPWFFDGDRGRYAGELLDAAGDARAKGLGLWGACPAAQLDPTSGLDTTR
ncbi:MAG TPA: thermonuclease family protein [Gaiellaceae bacterium]|nr:thermonuclease family protein [Gaiellaceae bacterium]